MLSHELLAHRFADGLQRVYTIRGSAVRYDNKSNMIFKQRVVRDTLAELKDRGVFNDIRSLVQDLFSSLDER